MEQLKFPHYASTKARILMWTADQVIPLGAMFATGLITDMLTLSLPIGLVLSYFYTKYSAGKPNGFLIHAAYWYGLYPIKARSAINPYNRRIYPK